MLEVTAVATQYLFPELTTVLWVPTLKDLTLNNAIPFELVVAVYVL